MRSAELRRSGLERTASRNSAYDIMNGRSADLNVGLAPAMSAV